MIKDPETLTGVVLNGAHGIYDVHTDNGILRCTLRGKLKKAFAQAQSTKLTGRAVSIKINLIHHITSGTRKRLRYPRVCLLVTT